LIRIAPTFLAVVALPLSAAVAQDQVGVTQISSSRAVVLSPVAPPKTTQAPEQLSSGDDSRQSGTQLAPPGTSREPTSQVAKAGRSAQPPESLSTPEEGRTGAIDPVTGHDRCDPANKEQAKTLKCIKVIENRAAQYARPSPTRLSPEQKLLIDRQLQAREESLADATHRLATSGDADNSLDGMGVASIVLEQGSKPTEPEEKGPDPQQDPAVQAILTILNAPPPPN
jgi:hypothetical protein